MVFNYLQLINSSFTYSEESRKRISDDEQSIPIQLDVHQRHDISTSELNGARFRVKVGIIDNESSEAKPEFGIVLLEGTIEYSFAIKPASNETSKEHEDRAMDALWLMARSQILQEFTLFNLPSPPIPLGRPQN